MANKKSKVQEVIDKVIGTKEEPAEVEQAKVEETQVVAEEAPKKATDYIHKELPSLLALRKKFGK
jgi:hypothetical protein